MMQFYLTLSIVNPQYMLLKRISCILISGIIYVSSFSQSNHNIAPVYYSAVQSFLNKIPLGTFQRDISQEAYKSTKGFSMPRMGYCINTSIDLTKDAAAFKSAEGNIYLYRCRVDGAKGLVPYFDSFYLAEGSSLHIYSADKSDLLGAFTHENSSNISQFCPGLIIADDIIFEYRPSLKDSENDMLIVKQLGIAYQMVPKKSSSREFGDSGPCQVNINCIEGQKFSNQKRSVVRIMVKSNNDFGWCSGTLINNTGFDCKPYVLLADHCSLDGNFNYAATSDFNQWVYYFNYESPDCNNPLNEGTLSNNSINGCSKIANSQDTGGEFGSDFLLAKLNSNPSSSYNLYFSGWNRENVQPDSGACIHHPEADLKKISTFRFKPRQSSWGGNEPNSHWEVNWTATTNGNGVTEGGSSGGSLFNSNGEIIGTLTGGESFCNNPSGADYFGKFFNHWDKNDNASNRQLKPWLDPINSGQTAISGRNACGVRIDNIPNRTNDFDIYPNPSNGAFQVSMKNDFEAILYSIDGKIIDMQSGRGHYLFSNLLKGIYILLLQSKTERIAQKVIIE
jgi:hypothetical protein